MNRKLYTLIILCLLLLSQQSCKDYLDLKGNNTQVVPTSLDDLQALLQDASTINKNSTPSLIEGWSDDFFVLPTVFERFPPSFQQLYLWDIDQINYLNDWSTCYKAIFPANFSLEGLKKINRTDENNEQYARIKGTALFFRAYFYLKLLWTYAPTYDEATASTDIGIVLKEDTDFNTPSVRSSVEEGYAKILRETKEALDLLPTLATYPTQPSKLAAHALLARAYLSMRKYEEALFHSDEALKIYDGLMDYNKPEDGVNANASIPFKKYNKETIFYTENNGYQGGFFKNSNGGRIDTVLFDTYEDHDLRKQLYFIKSGDYYQTRATYTETNYTYFTGLAFDELYLIRAECKARLNNVSEAMQDLNHLLRHRYDNTKPFIEKIAVNEKQALDIILLERRKSLIFRGLRWVDIKRLNKEGYNISIIRNIAGKEYILPPNDPKFVFPLPDDIRPFVQ